MLSSAARDRIGDCEAGAGGAAYAGADGVLTGDKPRGTFARAVSGPFIVPKGSVPRLIF